MFADGLRLALLLFCALSGAVARAQAPLPLPDLATQSALPINLDATSSEFDRRNNRLVFRGMHITQGALSIRADVAEATRLDFENSRWHFTGNVVIENAGTTVWCDDAELAFLGHQLRTAVMSGAPARFEQPRTGGKRIEGRAGAIDYDVMAKTVRMTNKAWLSDGANEYSGERIAYDLGREFVTADADGGGKVVLKINPPAKDNVKNKSGPAP